MIIFALEKPIKGQIMSGDKKRIKVYLLAAAVLVVAAVGMALAVRHHHNMRTALFALQEANQADTVFKSDSAALSLVRHFDSPACLLGTSNDRMLAHYLLGRAHADMGEAPAAIQDYYDAIECADTTAKDCDFYLLCRVYGQMSEIFYDQGLYKDAIHSDSIAIIHAIEAKDTFAAIISYENIGKSYQMIGKVDSVLKYCFKTNHLLCNLGYKEDAAIALLGVIQSYIDLGYYDKALHYCRIYEQQSGRFLTNGDTKAGFEIYYYLKGLSLLGIERYDSAEYYFRKELCSGLDIDNQHGAAYGLFQLYNKIGNKDSAIKYSMQSYSLNDSIYLSQRPQEIKRLQSSYNYQRHKNEAERMKDRNQRLGLILVVVLFICVLLLLLAYQYHSRKKREQQAIIELANIRLAQAQSDLFHLTAERGAMSQLISSKEQIIKEQQAILDRYRVEEKKRSLDAVDSAMFGSSIYQKLKQKLEGYGELTSDEWEQLHILIQTHIPKFFSTVREKSNEIVFKDYQLLILLRLKCRPSVIAMQMEITPQNVYNLRCRLHDKIFGFAVSSSSNKAEALDNWVKSLY